MNSRTSLLISLLSLGLALGAFYNSWEIKQQSMAVTEVATGAQLSPSSAIPSANPSPLQSLSQSLIQVAAKVTPAVVTVFTEKIWKERVVSPFDLFEQFFGEGDFHPRERERRSQGLGSGVFVSKDGIILTNNHVVAEADTISVGTLGKKVFKAKVLGRDPKTDIAVIKIEGDEFQYLEKGNSDQLKVGEIVLAVGSPMSPGLAHTVTQGIVSAVGRSNVGLAEYEDFIQTDAAINPGNSGGALVNLDGQLVGINSAIATQSGGSQGIGFAIPINMATNVKSSLLADGKVIRGYLGVNVQEVTEELAQALKMNGTEGVIVSDLDVQGPGASAGLQRGDVILSFNSDKIVSSADFRLKVAQTKPGNEINLKISRAGKEIEMKAKLTELSEEDLRVTRRRR